MSALFRNLLNRDNLWTLPQRIKSTTTLFIGAQARFEQAKLFAVDLFQGGVRRGIVGLVNDATENFAVKVYDDSAGERLALKADRLTGLVDFGYGARSVGQDVWRDGLVSIINATPGGFSLPNGLKVQGGVVTLAPSQTLTVALPYAYVNGHFAVVTGSRNTAGNGSGDVSAMKSGLTGVTLQNHSGSNSCDCQWLSFGW